MPRTLREVVFVDGVRTPFGKAGEKGIYAQTRADDLVIKCIRELIRRHPELPPERVEEVAIAATTQIGDPSSPSQGLAHRSRSTASSSLVRNSGRCFGSTPGRSFLRT